MTGDKTVTSAHTNTLDVVLYLASLVSDPAAIDTTLDKVRSITAQHQASQPYDPQDEAVLKEVQHTIENYLVHNDPVRNFTTEDLQQKIQEHFAPASHVHKQRRILVSIWVAAIILSTTASIAPIHIDPIVRRLLSAILTLIALGLGAAWFFITALNGFKPVLRPAYRLLCFSALLITLGELQLPLIPAFNLGTNPLFSYGGFTIPFTVAMAVLLAGLRTYAKSVNVGGRILRLTLVIWPGVIMTLIVILILHSTRPQYGAFFGLSMVSIVAEIYVAVWGIVLVRQIVTKITELYGRAVSLLGWMLFFSLVGSAIQCVILYLRGQLSNNAQLITAIPFTISQIYLLYSAYNFKKISRY